MRNRFWTATLLVMIMGALLAAAPARAEGFELTPVLGYRIGGEFEVEDSSEKLELDPAATFGFIFGFPLDDQSIIEVDLAHQETTLTRGSQFASEPLFDLGVTTIQAGGRYQSDHDKVKGFVSGGLGFSYFKPSGDLDGQPLNDEWAWVLSLGGGAIIPVSEKLAVRLEGRAIGTFLFDSSGAFCSQGLCVVSVDGSGFVQAEFRVGLAISF
jgi:opacity protein-like surface antigen